MFSAACHGAPVHLVATRVRSSSVQISYFLPKARKIFHKDGHTIVFLVKNRVGGESGRYSTHLELRSRYQLIQKGGVSRPVATGCCWHQPSPIDRYLPQIFSYCLCKVF